MEDSLIDQLQESEEEWADIEKLRHDLLNKENARLNKDKKIISHYCADNKHADITTTLELLLKYSALPEHDEETIKEFKQSYPSKLSVDIIHRFEDVKDIYSSYLESGGEYDD